MKLTTQALLLTLAAASAAINHLSLHHSDPIPVPKPSGAAVPSGASEQYATHYLPPDRSPITIDVGNVERQDDPPATQLTLNFAPTTQP